MGNCFRCYLRKLFISLALRLKYKKDCEILINNYFGTDFVQPLEAKIAQFPLGFRLKQFMLNMMDYYK